VGKGRRFIAALLALGFAVGTQARPSEMRIQYAEPVDIATAPGAVEFDAYGRRFTLELSPNDRLLASLPVQRKADLERYQLLRGKLAGQPNSWVRLTEFGGRVEGAIWDGQDLYAVTRHADIAYALTTPLPVHADQTVVFRLSDAFNALPANFCAVDRLPDASRGLNALEQYKSMVGELRANALGTPVTKQMDVALIADTEFQTLENTDTAGAMVARLNITDGIFAEQVGLLLNAGSVQLVPGNNDPFTTTDPSGLLQQVSSYRAATPAVRSAAIAHLLTGKSLTGTTLGIARISGVCDVNDGVSLSQSTLGVFMTGLIMAHELGHNLGAEHDGSGSCAGVSEGYIMWPSISTTSTRFSQCSLDAMRPHIDGASCLSPAAVADVTASLSNAAQGELQVPMTLTATVSSVGANLARGVDITFNIPGAVNPTAITSTTGTCTLSPTPSCSFGDIPAGQQRIVTITATPLTVTNQVLVTAHVSATNDRVVNNNSTFTTFAIVSNVDASVTVTPGTATARTGDSVEYRIRISSIRTATVRNASMHLTPSGLEQVTYTTSAGTCTASGSCNFGDLAPGASITLDVHGIAAQPGTWQHNIRLDSQNESGNNNFTSFDLIITPSVNVAITGLPGATISVGDLHTTQFTVSNTQGVQAATNVQVTLFASAWSPIQTAAVNGGTCNVESGSRATCQLGSMAVAETRTVNVTVIGAIRGSGGVSGRAAADRNEVHNDDDWTTGIDVRNPIDLRVAQPFTSDRVEGVSGMEHVPIYSNSTMAASDFQVTVELPATTRLTALSMADTTCQIVDAQHGRCTAVTLPHQNNRELLVTSTSDSPGLQRVRVAISASSEADTSDNTAEYDIRVNPYTDAAVTAISLPQYLFIGQVYEFETHLKTSYRDVPNVNFSVSYPVDVLVTAPADLTGCVLQHDVSNMYETLYCQMPLVAANTDRLLKFQLRPQSMGNGGRVGVQATTSGDVDWNNNLSEKFVQVIEMSDVSVQLAATTVSTRVNTTVALPRITVRSGAKDTHGIVVKIPLPSFVTARDISSGWMCSGTTTIECTVSSLQAGAETSFDISLFASQTGTFTSKVEVSAANDSNAGNNSADIAITVNAVTAPPSNPPAGGGGGGGGGGGRLEWLGLAVLTLLAARRIQHKGRDGASGWPKTLGRLHLFTLSQI
jgi:hypothetical protein